MQVTRGLKAKNFHFPVERISLPELRRFLRLSFADLKFWLHLVTGTFNWLSNLAGWDNNALPSGRLANEKRGVLAVVSFDRSRFKLFSRKFSNKCVLAPSCERLKTAPRTLFLSFESNNCFPITVYCSVGGLWKNLGNLHATWWIQTSLLVLYRHSKRSMDC